MLYKNIPQMKILSYHTLMEEKIVVSTKSLPFFYNTVNRHLLHFYRGADKSLAQPGRKEATITEDFDFHMFYL